MSEWKARPFRQFLAYLEEAERVLQLSKQGIATTSQSVPLVEVLHDHDVEDGLPPDVLAKSEKRVHSVRVAAGFAQKELDNDFPLLHAHTLVGIWGALEAAMEDLLVLAIQNDSAVRQVAEIRRVKVPVAEFIDLDAEERARLICQEVQRGLGADLRLGVGAFDFVLKVLGVSASTDDDTRRALLEFQQLRHVLVHRGGIADRRLLERCPWLTIKLGARILVGAEQYRRLVTAAADYVTAIVKRMLPMPVPR